jgi:hypothetical protein
VPVVVVTQSIHKWIDRFVKVEDDARTHIRKSIRDVLDIAIAKELAKEARAKEIAAAKKEAAREQRVSFRRPWANPGKRRCLYQPGQDRRLSDLMMA